MKGFIVYKDMDKNKEDYFHELISSEVRTLSNEYFEQVRAVSFVKKQQNQFSS